MKKLRIPFKITEHVVCNKLQKEFAVYLRLKFKGDKIKGSQIFDLLDQDKRTIQKHLKTLLALKWIGYNSKRDIYHIQSFRFIKEINGFTGRKATILTNSDLKHLQPYLAAVVICSKIVDQKYYWGKRKAATRKKDVAKQPSAPQYFGLSNEIICNLLQCKYTRAVQLKLQAEKLGYLVNNQKFMDLRLTNVEGVNREQLSLSHPKLSKRLVFINGNLHEQMYNEIIPGIYFKKRREKPTYKKVIQCIKDSWENSLLRDPDVKTLKNVSEKN
jgi:hypothetical protein